MTRAVTLRPIALLLDLLSALPASPPPRAPRGSPWLPVVTLRFTHRGAGLRSDLARDVPWGTTLELRLEWTLGGRDATTLPPEEP